MEVNPEEPVVPLQAGSVPGSRGAVSALPKRSVQELTPAGGISVLIIDDELDMREMLALSLPANEFEVVTADGGRLAVPQAPQGFGGGLPYQGVGRLRSFHDCLAHVIGRSVPYIVELLQKTNGIVGQPVDFR